MASFDQLWEQSEKPRTVKFDDYWDQSVAFDNRPSIEAVTRPTMADVIMNVTRVMSGLPPIPTGNAAPEDNPLRASLSPILGPTEQQIINESIPVLQPDGSTQYQYKPLGDRFQKEGLLAPVANTESVIRGAGLESKEDDSTLMSGLKGAGRAAVGIVNSLQSPVAAPLILTGGAEAAALRDISRVGARTAGTNAILEAGIPAVNRAGAGAFVAPMVAEIPTQTQSLGKSQNLGEAVERSIGLLASAGFGALGARYALSRAGLPLTAEVLSKTKNAEQIQPKNPIVLEPNLTLEDVASTQPQGVQTEVVVEPALTPEVQNVEEILANEPTSIEQRPNLAAEAQAPQETQVQEVNALPESVADVTSAERAPSQAGSVATEIPQRNIARAADARLSPLLVESPEAAALPESISGVGEPNFIGEQARKISIGDAALPTPEQRLESLDNPRAFKFSDITPPETVEQWTDLRNRREAAERKLLQEEIGITPEQAEKIHNVVFKREGNADKWAKNNLTSEQYEKYDSFFEESDYNQRGGPVDFFEYDDYYNPELLSGESNPKDIAHDLVIAFTGGAPKEGFSDKWVWTVSAIRKLQELGGTKEDISNQLRAQAGRVAGSEGDAQFWYSTHGKAINDLINRFAPDLPLNKEEAKNQSQKQAALPAAQPKPTNEIQYQNPSERPSLEQESRGNPQAVGQEEPQGSTRTQQEVTLGGENPPEVLENKNVPNEGPGRGKALPRPQTRQDREAYLASADTANRLNRQAETLNLNDPENAAAEARAHLLSKLDEYNPEEGAFSTWVNKIGGNKLKDIRRLQERGFTRDDVEFDSGTEFPNLGPGAANALEFALNPPSFTSTKNLITNIERAERGELSVLKEAVQTNEQTFEMAEGLLEKNPNLGRDTVVALLEGRKNQVSEVDEAILLYEKVRLRNERDMESDNASDPYSTEEERNAAKARWKDLEEQITQLDQATRRSGTIWGRLGQFRQRLLRDDYTFESMERKARVAKGRPLTPDESVKIKEQADKIAGLERQLEDVRTRLGEKDRQKAAEEATAQLLEEATKATDYDPQVETLADRIVTRLSVAAEKARARIRARLANASAGVDPTVLYDLSVIGAEKLAKGAVKFSRWAAEMVAEFGEVVQPYLQQAWEQSNILIDNAVEKSAPPDKRAKTRVRIKQDDLSGQRDYLTTSLKEAVEDGVPIKDLADLIRKIALNFVRSGIKERNPLLDAVHGVISEVVPISREATMDLLSGYGDYRLLDKEPAKATLRQLKGEMQQLGKIADMQAGQAAKKTGVERREPSAEERRLIREVNELKKRGGFTVTDPETQLRTALESAKTRLRNEIIDFDKAIADRIPITKKANSVIPDAEVEALKARRDAKRAEYDELFPKESLTEEELSARVSANLDRSISQLESDLKSGKLYPESKKRMTTPEIEAKRARLSALREERQTLRDLDTAVVEERKQAELRRAINRAQSDIPDSLAGVDTVDTKEVSDLKTQLAEIRQKRINEKRQDPSFVEAQKEASLLRRIEEAQAKSRNTKESPYTADTERVAKLKAQLAEIREAEANSPEAKQKKIDAAIKTTEESIRNLDKRIQEGDIAPKTPSEPRVTSPELEALSAERKAMTDLVNELRNAAKPKKTREEIALQAYKSRVAIRIADLQDKIARGDFAKKERAPLKLDKEGQDLAYKLLKQKEEFAKELFRFELKNRSLPRKALDEAIHLSNTLKAIITSIDLSAIGKQGGFITLSHPARAARVIPDMFRALASDKERHRINSELWNRPNAELYQRSKLAITDPNTVDLNKLEEAYMTRMLDRLETVPGEPVRNAVKRFKNLAFSGVRASERAYTTFLNVLRADSFDALAKAASKDGPLTKEESDAIASYVNVATGRGNFWGASQHGATLNSILWSPRLQASRIELLSGAPIWKKSSKRVKYQILNDYLRFGIGTAVLYNLALAAGFNIELDPRSSDFGKIRAGNTRVDVLAGLGQYITLLSRLISGENKTGKGAVVPIRQANRPLNLIRAKDDPLQTAKKPFIQDTAFEVLSRFGRTKLNPLLGTTINVATGENAVGEQVGLTEAAKSLITPLSLSQVTEPFEKEGIPKGSLITLLNILGFSANTYGDKPIKEEK